MGVFRPMTTLVIAGLVIAALTVWGHHNRNALKQTKLALTFVSQQMALLAQEQENVQQTLRREQATRARLEAEHRDLLERLRTAPDPEYREWAKQPLPEAVLREFGAQQETQ